VDLYYVTILCVLVLSEVGTSVFRNAEIPKVGGSDYRSADSAFRISDLGNKGISLFYLYLKASEFQCSSVYCWSSLEADLLLLITIKLFSILLNFTSCSFS